MGDRNIYNFGTYIEGDIYGENVLNGDDNVVRNSTAVYISDPGMILQLLVAAEQIHPKNENAKEKVEEIKTELKSDKPKVGKLQALYDWLRRNCTVDNTLKSIKAFGELLIKAVGMA